MKLDSRFVDNSCTTNSKLKLMEEKDVDKDMQNFLLDDYAKNILKSIKTSPKSILQLCTESKIPTSTGYRIMQKLYSRRLVKRTYAINMVGRKTSLYKIRLEEAQCQ